MLLGPAPAGNTSSRVHVVTCEAPVGTRLWPLDDSRDHLDQEDPTITTLTSPATMSHVGQDTDIDWVEASDELQGTAVFDATGDRAAMMPSWDELVRQHADRVYRLAYRLSGKSAGRRGPSPRGDFHQGVPFGAELPARNLRGLAASHHHEPLLDMVRRRGRIRMEACLRITTACLEISPIRSRSTTTRDWVLICRPHWTLTPEFRAAVVLCDVEGLSYEEIGATLGVRLGTVRSRIHRGRQALRDYLSAPWLARRGIGLTAGCLRSGGVA